MVRPIRLVAALVVLAVGAVLLAGALSKSTEEQNVASAEISKKEPPTMSSFVTDILAAHLAEAGYRPLDSEWWAKGEPDDQQVLMIVENSELTGVEPVFFVTISPARGVGERETEPGVGKPRPFLTDRLLPIDGFGGFESGQLDGRFRVDEADPEGTARWVVASIEAWEEGDSPTMLERGGGDHSAVDALRDAVAVEVNRLRSDFDYRRQSLASGLNSRLLEEFQDALIDSPDGDLRESSIEVLRAAWSVGTAEFPDPRWWALVRPLLDDAEALGLEIEPPTFGPGTGDSFFTVTDVGSVRRADG